MNILKFNSLEENGAIIGAEKNYQKVLHQRNNNAEIILYQPDNYQ